jgi:pSer/pThr/pTyr-binding forkhead associated (FHA) protein
MFYKKNFEKIFTNFLVTIAKQKNETADYKKERINARNNSPTQKPTMAAINMYHLRRIFVPEGEDGLISAATSNGTPGPTLNGTSSLKDLNGTEKLENIPKEKLAEFRSKCTVILLDELTKIGRNPELVDVVLNSKTHSNMISRNHSEIHGARDENGKYTRYYIVDRSLNGTYINETRAQGEMELHEGDIIKFGHVNGAAIKAGNFAPQQYAEFVFRVNFYAKQFLLVRFRL